MAISSYPLCISDGRVSFEGIDTSKGETFTPYRDIPCLILLLWSVSYSILHTGTNPVPIGNGLILCFLQIGMHQK